MRYAPPARARERKRRANETVALRARSADLTSAQHARAYMYNRDECPIASQLVDGTRSPLRGPREDTVGSRGTDPRARQSEWPRENVNVCKGRCGRCVDKGTKALLELPFAQKHMLERKWGHEHPNAAEAMVSSISSRHPRAPKSANDKTHRDFRPMRCKQFERFAELCVRIYNKVDARDHARSSRS